MGAKSLAAITPLLPILPVEKMWSRCAATWLIWRRHLGAEIPSCVCGSLNFLRWCSSRSPWCRAARICSRSPTKIDLARDQYFVVQKLYRGWALFGVVLFGALIASLTE
jgi:hypothetical protein